MGEEHDSCCFVSSRSCTIITGVTEFVLDLLISYFFIISAVNVTPLSTFLGIPGPFLMSLLITVAVLCIITAVFDILLIVGALVESKSYLIPWLISSPIVLLILIVLELIAIWYMIGIQPFGFVLTQIFFVFLIVVMKLFAAVCVYKFYRELKKEDDESDEEE